MSDQNVGAIVDLCREIVALDDAIRAVNNSRISSGITDVDGTVLVGAFDATDLVTIRDVSIRHLHDRLHPPEQFAR